MHAGRPGANTVLVALSGVLMLGSTLLIGQASPTPCVEPARGPAAAAALRPSDVLLAISSPRAGEMVTKIMPSESVTVSVDYWGPHLVPANTAHAMDEDHLVFFLDSDDSAYVGTLQPAPRCDSHIVHSASTSVTFDHVMHGPHTLWVMLVGSNDVSVNPPVAASVSFVVK